MRQTAPAARGPIPPVGWWPVGGLRLWKASRQVLRVACRSGRLRTGSSPICESERGLTGTPRPARERRCCPRSCCHRALARYFSVLGSWPVARGQTRMIRSPAGVSCRIACLQMGAREGAYWTASNEASVRHLHVALVRDGRGQEAV